MNPSKRLGRAFDRLHKSLAPDQDKADWLREVADALGYEVKTVRSWCYGRSLPDQHGLDALVAYFKSPFLNLYFGPLGYEVVDKTGLSADDVLEQVEGFVVDLRTRAGV